MAKKICIVMPTYNEAENVFPSLKEIFSNWKNKNKLNILIVDDNSPDKTYQKVKEFQNKNVNGKKVKLLIRTNKEGLGKAYIAGFKYALQELKADVLVEMDIDGQHNPKDVSRLIYEIDEGYDFVIGSRFVKGGSTSSNQKLYRKIISFLATTTIRLGLGLTKVKDCSGGFRAITKETINKIDLDSLNVKGYAFQAAILEAAKSSGAKIKEIPIQFRERKVGESKMRIKDLLEGFKLIYYVRKQKIKSSLNEIIKK